MRLKISFCLQDLCKYANVRFVSRSHVGAEAFSLPVEGGTRKNEEVFDGFGVIDV